MKKVSILLLLTVLLLTACAGNASLIKDSVLYSLEHPAVTYESKITLDMDSTLFQGEPDPVRDMILALLKKGIVVRGHSADTQNARMQLTAADGESLRQAGIWPFDVHPSLDIIVKEGSVYVKTSADDKYVEFANTMGLGDTGTNIDPAKLKELEKKVNDLLLSAVKNYIKSFNFRFANVKDHGLAAVTLPSGKQVTAKHVEIAMDEQELYDMTVYILKDWIDNGHLKTLLSDLYDALAPLAAEADPAMKQLFATKNKSLTLMMAESWVKTQLRPMIVAMEGKKVADFMKESGIAEFDLTLVFHYYISEETKQTVKTDSAFTFLLKENEAVHPIQFAVSGSEYYWDYGVVKEIPVPSPSVSILEMEKNRELIKQFKEGSPLRLFLEGYTATQPANPAFKLEWN